jgi:adenylate cyclase
MTISYPSIIAEAKRSMAVLAAELSAISVAGIAAASAAEGGSRGPAAGGLGVPELRNALKIANRASIAAGLLAHPNLMALSSALRAFLHASAVSPSPEDSRKLERAAALVKDCADALDAAPEYAELVLPGGSALRPPLLRRIDVLPFCAEILRGDKPPRSPFDGRRLDCGETGKYRILISPDAAAKAASRGAWLSLSYFDPSQGGFRDCVRSLETLIDSGSILRYGSLGMSATGLERAEAILPCYAVAETAEEPGAFLPGKLPGLRLLRVISSPHKAFIPDPASSGPSAGAFSVGSGFDEDEAPCAEAAAEPAEEGLSPFHDSALEGGIELPDIEEKPDGGMPLEEFGHSGDFGRADGFPVPDPMRAEANELEGAHREDAPAPAPAASKANGAPPSLAEPEELDQGAKPAGPAKGVDKIRLSLAVKLIGIISLVIVAALTTMISLASYLFKSEIENTVEDSNLQVADSSSLKFDSDFLSIADRAARVMQAYRLREAAGPLGPEAEAALARELFASEAEILVVSAFPSSGAGATHIANERTLSEVGMDATAAGEAAEKGHARAAATNLGGSVCLNASADFREPAILVTYPFTVDGETGSLLVAFNSRDRIQSAVAPKKLSMRQISLVSQAGEILAHPDGERVTSPEPLAGRADFEPLKASKVNAGSFVFKGENGSRRLAYYAKVPSIGAWALVTVDEEAAFEAVNKTLGLNAMIAVMIVALAVLIVYFFSKTITLPLRALVDAAKRIEEGHFHLRLKPRARDEVGLLTSAFVHMGDGLAERQRLKDTFGKFVNKEVAERAAKGTIKLGGERKAVTVFFSDIRDFTSISERMEPEEVVDFLNRYMTRMVGCVNAAGGNVDKFIGDAIMAVWGAPLAELSEAEYAEKAVDAALNMRKELRDFNKDRGGPRTPVIRIGCGLNSGPVIVGQIGSTERIEYTVIGDAVNLASRIEALNKPFATDILVSEDTYALVKGVFRFEPMKPILVKGKNEPQQIYAVLGRLDDPYALQSIEEVRTFLGIERKDISAVNVDEEEVKYKILPTAPAKGKKA